MKQKGSSHHRPVVFCEFNLENLFIGMEYYKGQDLERLSEDEWRALALPQLRRKQKPLFKVWGVAKAILDIDPDVLMLTEVGGKDSLENLNKYFLGDRYIPLFIEGNSARGIDLGFLVKRDLSLRVEARSNKETPVEVVGPQGPYTTRFSRDVAELRLYDGEQPKLTAFLVHLKSQLSTLQDMRGKDVRTAEAIALAALYENRRAAEPNVPVLLAGDFNADISSLELELIRRTDLRDFHDVLQTPPQDRTSLVHFEASGVPRELVLDYILISPELEERVVITKSYTYRYKGFYDVPERAPKTLREKHQMPSDHYPLVLALNLSDA